MHHENGGGAPRGVGHQHQQSTRPPLEYHYIITTLHATTSILIAMIQSDYKPNAPGATRKQMEQQELSDYILLCDRLQTYIIRISGDFAAAVHQLHEAKVDTRFVDASCPAGDALDLLRDLQSLAYYLEDNLAGLKAEGKDKAV